LLNSLKDIPMQAPSWITLFERIPATLHDCLVLTLATGAEIMMQSVLRLESDYAIIRGRMAGSTDAGRVIVLPFDQIVNLAFAKRMLEPEVQAVFGDLLTGAAEPNSATGEEEEVEAQEITDVEECVDGPSQGPPTPMNTKLPQPKESVPAKNKPVAPSKSILLARLRARLAEQGK
jgi:hypothetical protein